MALCNWGGGLLTRPPSLPLSVMLESPAEIGISTNIWLVSKFKLKKLYNFFLVFSLNETVHDFFFLVIKTHYLFLRQGKIHLNQSIILEKIIAGVIQWIQVLFIQAKKKKIMIMFSPWL